jgi:hypothetical protein
LDHVFPAPRHSRLDHTALRQPGIGVSLALLAGVRAPSSRDDGGTPKMAL